MLNVSLRCLEVFLAVIDTGSFAKAAERLGIAQPSVSEHIRSLEKHVGGPVFDRRRGARPALSDIGLSLRQHARELLAEADDLRLDIVNIQNATGQRLVFACQRSLANFVLKDPITRFALTKPSIQLVMRIGTQEEVIEAIHNGTADLGCYLGDQDIRGVNSEVIGAQRLRLVAAPTHPLVGVRKIKPAAVEKYGFVGQPPGSLFGKTVAHLLSSAGIRRVKYVAQVTEYQFLRELVAAGVGISCSPEMSVSADVNAGFLAMLDLDAADLMLNICLISSHNRPRTQAMDELREHLLRSRAEQEQLPPATKVATPPKRGRSRSR